MPHIRQMPGQSSDAIGAADVPAGAEVTRRIAAVDVATLDKDTRTVLRFEGSTRYMVLNKTNGARCTAMFGPMTEDWHGKRITITMDPDITFGRDRTGGLVIVGSPDIERDIVVSVKVSRKNRRNETLRRTATGAAKAEPTQAEGVDPGHQLGD